MNSYSRGRRFSCTSNEISHQRYATAHYPLLCSVCRCAPCEASEPNQTKQKKQHNQQGKILHKTPQWPYDQNNNHLCTMTPLEGLPHPLPSPCPSLPEPLPHAPLEAGHVFGESLRHTQLFQSARPQVHEKCKHMKCLLTISATRLKPGLQAGEKNGKK